jgi:phospholipase C
MLRKSHAALLGCLAAACTSKEPEAPSELPGPAEWNRVVVPPSDDTARQNRASCSYKKGALPAETQGASYPMGTQIPIDHILVIMMENRSFDHYFQKLPEYGQPGVDVAKSDFSNPDPDGKPVTIFRDTQYCFVDTAHGWNPVHKQVNDGKMDGFVTTSESNHEAPAGGTLEMLAGDRAMGYYDHTDLPFYYWLANTFAIGDRYFCSLQGPTYPNRMYLYAASSLGLTGNTLPPQNATLILDYLDQRKIDWRIYRAGTPGISAFVKHLQRYGEEGRLHSMGEYFADAKNGTLPQFAFVDPNIGLSTGKWDTNDEHPPAMAQFGERFVADVVDALTKSPNWSRSALFVTYDEHGGLYDHVVPPKACPPDELEPKDSKEKFDEYGIRVPFLVVSPYAKKHHVSHEVYDHTSIVRFIEARFVMPALTHRDANALAPFDMFDFKNPPHLEPPKVTLPPAIPTAKSDACRKIFTGK